MWVPKNEDEIINACENSSLEETSIFDAKREIPPKNVDVAKDVSAFANTSGGTIVFGIGENESGRATIPSPIELKGQRERIDSIIRTSISEVPVFNITQVESEAENDKGYLVLTIPPSERAPHMVVVKGERRFYGRGETGNYVLSEAEVARLYERRELTRSSIIPLLEDSIRNCPIKDHLGFAHLHIVIKPVIPSENILESALDPQLRHSQALNALLGEMIEANVFAGKRFHPDFNVTTSWSRTPDGYVNHIWKYDKGGYGGHALSVAAHFDGSGYLFCSRAADTEREGQHHVKWFMSDLVAGHTVKFLDFFGRIYRKASYFGMVDIAVGLTGLYKCVSIDVRNFATGSTYEFDREKYERAVRVSAMELDQDPTTVATRLVMPLISTITQGRYDPFN